MAKMSPVQDAWFMREIAKRLRPVRAAVARSPKRGDVVDGVLARIMRRVDNSALVIRTIRKQHGDADLADAATILRTMYDASLQAQWIVHDLNRSAELAEDYRAFAELEREKFIRQAERDAKAGLRVGVDLMSSSQRAANETAIRAAIDKAKKRFSGVRKRDNWFCRDCGNLRVLATKLNLQGEYDWIIKALHGPLHTTPLFLLVKTGPAIAPRLLDWVSLQLVLRTFAAAVKYHEIVLSAEAAEVLDGATENIVKAFPGKAAQGKK